MKSFRLPGACRLLLTLVVAILLASEIAEAQTAVPFKAAIAITERIQTPSDIDSCYLVGVISGSGQASQLGRTTLVSRDCINPISQTEFSFASDQLVFTIANGDQVFATYSGTLTTTGALGVISGGYQIVGGTGRFLHASGAGSVQGVEDMSTGIGQVQLTGTISY